MSKKKYPRALKTKFEFKETAGDEEKVQVVCNCYDGIVFLARVGINFDDWDKLVEWVEKTRHDRNKP